MKCQIGGSKAGAAVAAVMGLALVAGCEWTGGGGVDSWNDRYNFLNFSGVYRGINGGLLITDYSSELSTGSETPGSPGSTNNITGERIGTGNGSSTVFSGMVDHSPVNAGSLSINASGFSFTDDDGDGSLSVNGGASGNFNYDTGQFNLTFPAALDDGVKIVASYQYTISGTSGTTSSGTGSGTRGNATSGTSKKPIYSITVEQAGNVLRLTDSNGATYDGELGDIRSAGGVDQDNTQQNGGVYVPSAGDEFVGSFTAEGVSAAGYTVKIVGTLQAVVQSSSQVSGSTGSGGETPSYSTVVLEQRKMYGTWIESGGRTGDIVGESSPVTVNATSTGATN